MPIASTMSILADLTGGTLRAHGGADPVILDVTHDSRQVTPDSLFVAIEGQSSDGHQFVSAAIRAGAVGVCVTRHVTEEVPELVVKDTRTVLGSIAAEVHDHPSRSMSVIGVTGTNGKTTVTHYIEAIALSAGRQVGLIGTIVTRYPGHDRPSLRTTPEASDFQRLLAEMRQAEVEMVAAEVSSHALALHRVGGTRFEVAAFTNLSQDHLDFHGDMTRYYQAKARLFSDYEVGTAVVNIDDEAGSRIARGYQGDLVTVGTAGMVSHSDPTYDGEATHFEIETPWGSGLVRTPILGRFNVSNAVIAAACCLAAGIGFEQVTAGLGSLAPVPGRFELVSGEDPIRVIVDYAHTPDGIAEAIASARDLASGRVIAVAGAGGDRDQAKRPLMGRALSDADLAIVTSDNPRTEDPGEIIDAVASGLDPSTKSVTIESRSDAIDAALQAAENGDIVLVLGRGHEPTQDLGATRVPFDDRELARAALAKRRRSANSGAESGRIGR